MSIRCRYDVKQHESQLDEFYDPVEPPDYQINNTNVQSKKPSATLKISPPRDVWFKLSEEDCQIIVDFNRSFQDSPVSAHTVQAHSLDTNPEPDPDLMLTIMMMSITIVQNKKRHCPPPFLSFLGWSLLPCRPCWTLPWFLPLACWRETWTLGWFCS